MARKATKKDINRAIEILAESFPDNPSVVYQVKQDKKVIRRYNRLAKHVVLKSSRKHALYFSNDGSGIMVFYQFNTYPGSVIDKLWDVWLAVSVIGIGRTWAILKKENSIAQKRPKDGKYLYVWFIGVEKSERGKGAGLELKNFLFEEADKMSLPIYMETTIPQNKKVYERYGFETYEKYRPKNGNGIVFWLMRRI